MKRVASAIVLAVFGMILLAPVGAPFVQASANSAPSYWQGAESSGPMLTENCPITVTEEHLHLEIPNLPSGWYDTAEQLAEYGGKVTAEYTFHNPTTEAVEVRLAFPFGARPAYLSAELDDTSRFSVTVDGAPIERNVRYTWEPYGDYDVSNVQDSMRQEGFFTPDLAVTQYTVTGIPKDCIVLLTLSYNPLRTQTACGDGYSEFVDGYERLNLYEYGRGSVSFTAYGELPKVEKAEYMESGREQERQILPLTADMGWGNSMELQDALEEIRPPEIGKVDFFNAASAYLSYMGGTLDRLTALTPFSMQRWFVYTLSIPAGGTVKNAVTAPLYPDKWRSGYDYTYLLSPASAWADFGTLTITVDTPYELSDCSLPLEKGETGYIYAREGLPLGELTFSIGGSGENDDGIGLLWLILLVPLGVRLVGGIAALIAVFAIHVRKKTKKT